MATVSVNLGIPAGATDAYVEQPMQVQAWKFTATATKPAWLTAALASGDVYYQGGDKPYFTTAPLGLRCGIGDWLLRDMLGRFFAMPDAHFVLRYKKV